MTLKPEKNFWAIQGDFISNRHHVEFRIQLYVSKEETFLVPLTHIDVTRSTHTDLDVMQEKRVEDYWNVVMNRSLSDSWTGFTKILELKEKRPNGFLWFGEKISDDY